MTDQSVTERKRFAILDAARTIFSRKGYAETAVDDVAEEAGVAKGTLYLYFKSKEELYLAALVSDVRAMTAEARKEMERASGLREKLRAFLRMRVEFSKLREDFLRIYLAEYGNTFIKSVHSTELMQLVRENMRYVAKVFEQASLKKEIGPVPAGAAAAALFDIARGLMERRLLGWKEFRAANEVDFSIDLLMYGIQAYGKSTPKRAKRASAGRRVSPANLRPPKARRISKREEHGAAEMV
ncbi:MAG TPA: TetR/AcrR family transcriptional regulator [Bryobacteraceae bacterium]|nr:TetR/AcrR family transcriptional regulator [Bryobacteraceae bacterium]